MYLTCGVAWYCQLRCMSIAKSLFTLLGTGFKMSENKENVPLGSCADGETATAEWLFPPARDQQ